MAEELEKSEGASPADDGRAIIGVIRTELQSGPLPDPQTLKAYDRVFPGLAERIVAQFEKEAEHRRSGEDKILQTEIEESRSNLGTVRRGQLFAFVVGLVGLIVGGSVAMVVPTGAGAAAGSTIAGVTLVGLVTAFLAGKKGAGGGNSAGEPPLGDSRTK